MAAIPGGGQGMNNLTTLIKRLEAATSRLEDIASSSASFDGTSSHAGSVSAPSGVTANGVAVASPASTVQPAAAPAAAPLPKSVEDIDELIGAEVQKFVDASKGLDPLVEEQASNVASAFQDQRRFILTSTKAKKPDMQSKVFMDLLSDLQQDLGSIGDIRDSNRASPMKEHLAMVGEGVTALQWLVMEGKPADYVSEVTGGAQMYGNRVLKAYKDREQSHVSYVQSYYALLKALHTYILKHYPSGITWNNNGIDASQAYAESGAATANNAAPGAPAGAPAPPPPPPLPIFDTAAPPPPPPPGPAPTNKAAGGDMGAVFEQLNRGEAVTSGLKKVDKSQMTHKNPALRASSTVPDKNAGDISRSRSPGPEIKPKPASMRQNSTSTTVSTTPTATSATTKKAPKKELDGNKWLIENFDSPSAPIELDVSLTQSILVTNCKKTTLVVRGKANAISIDHSPRLQLLVDNLVSSIDIISSPNIAVQVTGTLPTLLLDQVDGASVYLSKETLDTTEILTSKCTSVNIVLPPDDAAGGADADSTECPVPEQIRTTIKGGKVVSEIVEHAG